MSHLEEFADAFLSVFRSHRLDRLPSAPIASLSLDDAYVVQQMVVDRRVADGEEVVGYKVGCTSRAIRQQFGLSEPICGCLLRPHIYVGDTQLAWQDFHRPAIEPEFVFRISRDLTNEVGPDESLCDAIEFVSPGIEVHHYDWWFGEPTSQELVCSNGIHAGLVIGTEKLRPKALDLSMEEVGVFTRDELKASGIGAEIMGGPIHSLRWLVNHLVHRGESVRAGQIVIPGSPVALIPVSRGDRVIAKFTNLGAAIADFQG